MKLHFCQRNKMVVSKDWSAYRKLAFWLVKTWFTSIDLCILKYTSITLNIFEYSNVFEYPPPRFCATAWLIGHEFCVLSSVLEFWLMVYGFVFEKLPFGGVNMDSPVVPVAKPHPLSGSLKPTENLFFELLAASGSFQERLGVPGIDSSCKEIVFYRFLMPIWLQLASQNRLKSLKIRCQDALHLELQF